MVKILSVVCATLVLSGLALPALAGLFDIPEGVVVQSSGVQMADLSCASSGCAGDFVECAPGEAIIVIHSRFRFVDGVCDDAGDTPCAGRLRARAELCFDPTLGGPDVILDGLILSSLARGRSRVCFDDTGEADCSDPLPPGVEVVAEATALSQTRRLLAPTASGELVSSPIQTTIRTEPTLNRSFVLDGKRTRVMAEVVTCHATVQPDPDRDNCAAINAAFGQPPGCGFASTAVEDSRRLPGGSRFRRGTGRRHDLPRR